MSPQANSRNAADRQKPAGIGIDDVYFTIFRHKKLLVVCFCLGLIGVAVVRSVMKPVYSSHAKLFVRYVLDRPEINPDSQGANILSASSGNGSVLSSEREILASLDVAKEVAETVGPEKILAAFGGGTNLLQAAGVVRSGIGVTAQGQSEVMVVSFQHPTREVVQPVLNALIQAYLQKHVEVRQGTLFSESHYSEQLTALRRKLAVTEDELKKVLTGAGVISVADAKRTYGTQIEKFKGELLDAKGELFALEATLNDDALSTVSTNSMDASIPADKLDYYATVLAGLNELRKRERELLLKYTEAHPLVTAARESIAQLKQKKSELEKEHPGLALSGGSSAGTDLTVELAKIRALKSKVRSYESLLTNLQAEAVNLLDVEPRIAELERQREEEAKSLQYVSSSLDRARADEISGNRVTGINIVETPTPPGPDDKKIVKMMGAVFGAFFGLGLGIAVLIDFVLDRTIRRSVDVRRHMRLPFFISIPDTRWSKRRRLPGFLYRNGSGNGKANNGAVAAVLPPWDSNHHLRLYAEGVRERLITNFEVNGVNHKPKLVGVTSCGEGAGATTLASGVAAALSKIGDGNVLLVDMNGGQGATHSFYKGKPECSLPETPEPEASAEVQVQENLYLVSLRSSDAPDASDDEKSARLLPGLKASDYDYVVFDMPPVTPTSVTPRLATNMDRVLLVIESEKTSQQVAVRAGELLAEAHANAAVILNKCRQYVPSLLSQEM
jgi:uncharacterized protein involved in exopolysaccharide biosynthesis/Mrp family chromosome partitioning ATPase